MARFKARFSNTLSEKFKTNPLFFLKYKYSSYYNDFLHEEVDASQWISTDKDLNLTINAKDVEIDINPYQLCLVELNTKKVQGDVSEYEIHTVSAENTSDLKQVFIKYINHAKDKEEKYPFIELLWLLNTQDFKEESIKDALTQLDSNSAKWVCSGLTSFGSCLSVKKQQKLKNILPLYGYTFNIYIPRYVEEALSYMTTNWQYTQSDKNVFETVDYILNPENEVNNDSIAHNKLLELRNWFENQSPYSNYQFLINLFALVCEDVKLKIIKRWFHDIRLGNTNFDSELLLKFKDNPFDNFVRFRHCIERPGEAIVLTVPLLADNILTLYNSNGKNFQTFDGVLDFAIKHCDTSHPAIDFKMNRFLPVCNGGTQYNNSFVGFIDYALIRELDETKINHKHALQVIEMILNRFAERMPYHACVWNDSIPLSQEQLKRCHREKELKTNTETSSPHKFRLECCVTRYYKDKWLVKKHDSFDFNVFLKEQHIFSSEPTEIDISMISTNNFLDYIRQLPSHFTHINDGTFLVPSYRQKTLPLQLVEEFSSIKRMRIYPNKNVYAGLDFDIFGIHKRLIEEIGLDNPQNLNDTQKKVLSNIYVDKERSEVYTRIVKSLKSINKLGVFNEMYNYFETNYDKELLEHIIKKYYFKESISENMYASKRSFLTIRRYNSFKPFCSPKVSRTKNEVLDFPFFWCRGNECFHNCLGNQTLAEMNDWHQYSMFHLIEIIGFPKLHLTEAGYEASTEVIQFIAVANKAMQKFRQLKCRTCGHLMFTYKSNGFNRNNYYACINRNCTEYNTSVYLNYCFKCKKGLIDSRDSKKCPNGWHICPTCLACCDDEQFERQAQRYVISGLPIPSRIQEKRGMGHNDKNIHFCPKCGTQITLFQDDHGDYHKGCPECRIEYNV